MKPSADYWRCLEQAKRHHASSKTYSGKFLRPRAGQIKEIIERLDCHSALDYGCGKGRQYEWIDPSNGLTLEQYWGLYVFKYDPAYPPFAAEPTDQFDLVICTHVLGSIPRGDLKWVIDRLYGFARKAMFIAEQIGQSRKRVFTDESAMPVYYSEEKWARTLRRASPVEVTLFTRRRTPQGTFPRTEVL